MDSTPLPQAPNPRSRMRGRTSSLVVPSEASLHKAIAKLLSLKKIVFVHSRTDRPTTQQKGVPDFLFAVRAVSADKASWRVEAVAWEVKTERGKLRPEQAEMHFSMQRIPNYWRVKVIRSLDDAIAELDELGL